MFVSNPVIIHLFNFIEQHYTEEKVWDLENQNEEELRHIEGELNLNIDSPNLKSFPPSSLCGYLLLYLKQYSPICGENQRKIWFTCQCNLIYFYLFF